MVPSIGSLPVELLHRIFDYLDVETIFFSIRSLCRLFRSVVNTYDRYVLHFNFISKSNFHILCRLINPRNVTSLTLSSDERTPNYIHSFISLVRLRQFTRLRSLTFLNIDEGQFNFILKRINLTLLTSFSFTIAKYDNRRRKTTTALLSSTLAQKTLRKLEFFMCDKMPIISWPINSTIQYLTINNYININNFCRVLQDSPHLHTLIMSSIPTGMIKNLNFPQLTSLTIEDLHESIDELEPFLLLTPSLVYLKLLGGTKMMDGKRWEQFIETHLSQLNKFEFYFTEYNSGKQITTDVELIIASYQTPFWIEQKKWFVTCECDMPWENIIHLYSIPICKSCISYTPKSEKISLSTYSMVANDDSSIMDNIKALTFTWDQSTADEIQEKKAIANHPLFPNVTEIDIEFCKGWLLLPLQSLSTLIDIPRIVCIKIRGYYFNQYNENTWMDIGIFMKEAHNLTSLIIQNGFQIYLSDRTIENIYSNLPHHVRHLQTPINNIDQINMILERCENLSTINFDIKDIEFSKKVINWFGDNTINTTCRETAGMVAVWLGKRKIQSNVRTIDHKRIKLTDKNSYPLFVSSS